MREEGFSTNINHHGEKRLLLIESVRLGFLVIILFASLAFQFHKSQFISIDVLLPLYGMLCGSFLINGIYLSFFKNFFDKIWSSTAFLFGVDTLFTTGLILFTGINQSIFIFLYLVNISLCGFIFQRKGAFILALFTSILFSLSIIIGPDIEGQSLFFAVGLNNFAFLAVAGLSGYLSEQLNFMGSEIEGKEQEIQQLQDLNDLIVENISTGLMTVDLDGVLLHCNSAAKTILGVKFPSVGKDIFSVIPKLKDEMTMDKENKVTFLSRRTEITFINERDEELILGMSISPLYNRERTHSGYIFIFQDLTKIKRLERAMRRQEKLAAVGQLAAGIAHEIRNPLASISGSVQLLSSTLQNATEEDQYLMKIVLKEIERLNRLISEFLEFVRPDFPVHDPIDLGHLLNEILNAVKLNNSLRGDVNQVFEINSSHKILGNKDKLKQVFLNLIINAYQAMESSENPELTVRVYENDNKQLTVEVKDNGQGMSEKNLNRVFEPFHTTKPKGTGLGLATALKIIENHEGEIHAESQEGRGTCFYVVFTRLFNSYSEDNVKPLIRSEQDEESENVALKFSEELNKFNMRKRGKG